jgi:Zn-dependent protease
MALGLIAAYCGFRVLIGIAVFVQLLRLPLRPVQVERVELPPPLSEDQEAAVEELRSLGFEPCGTSLMETEAVRYTLLFFRHSSLPCFASLTTLPAGNIGYPVAFYTFAAEGNLLLTDNRVSWSVFAWPPHVRRQDASATSLQNHWQTHQARITGTAPESVSEQEAQSRIESLATGYLPLLQSRRLCTQDNGVWHPSMRAAAKAALAWLRVSRKLARRYVSPVTSGDYQVGYFSHCYIMQEALLANRPARRKVKLAVLALSMAATLVLWGLLFNWSTAMMLVGIVFVHELGHALAMRWFGYRDMSMFFIPFVGAIVTGKPRDLATWKQAMILFAGPLPGLLVGLAILVLNAIHPLPLPGTHWRTLAEMAIAINFFNLLPFSPLDGGQLMDISLFSRWPVSRLVFAVLSACAIAAIAIGLKTPSLMFVAVVLALGMRSQFRIMRLQPARLEGLDRQAQIRHLFAAAKHNLRVQTYAIQAALVKAVLARRTVRKARAWESVLVLSVLLAVWGAAAAAAFAVWHPNSLSSRTSAEGRTAQPRTAPQTAFDNAYDDDDDDNNSLATLDKLARELSPDDPRRVDLAYLHGMQLQGEGNGTPMEDLLAAHRDGYISTIGIMEEGWLDEISVHLAQLPPAERAAALASAINRAMQLVPGGFAATVDTRLREAEAIDQSGDPSKAEAQLLDLRQRAASADDCRCALKRVITAQARFDLSRHRAAQAVTVLESSPFSRELRRVGEDLATTYALALLDAGRISEGVDQMRQAALYLPPQSTLLQRMLGKAAPKAVAYAPFYMAYAWHVAGQDAKIQSLDAKAVRRSCLWELDEHVRANIINPWNQASRVAMLDFAKSFCAQHDQKNVE